MHQVEDGADVHRLHGSGPLYFDAARILVPTKGSVKGTEGEDDVELAAEWRGSPNPRRLWDSASDAMADY